MNARQDQDPARSLAERIASRLAKGDSPDNSPARRESGANVGDELAALRASVSEIGQRLTQIESHVTGKDAPSRERTMGDARHGDAHVERPPAQEVRRPQLDQTASTANGNPAHWLSGTYVPAVHPSEERFGIDEAVSELVEFFEREKVCNVEPGGKPCDHCGMCSSRGF
ncbi:MAG TPA: hypothetical protein VEY11_05985 [Pyrinomonadaceae bacterium]|nr:hypothetical protein [Pyrinomonadaceae bacterium]